MWIAFLQGISFGMAPIVSVGPFKIFVFSQALQQGWRKAIHLALVPLVADIPVVVLLWFVIQQLPKAGLTVLRLVGGLFYLFLAYRIVRSARQAIDTQKIETAPQRSFLQAITAVWVTPAVYINWSTIGIPAMLGYAEQSTLHMIGFLLGFYVLWIGSLALQIYIVGQAGAVNEKANTGLVIIAVLLLVWFGLFQLWTAGSSIFGY